MHGRRGNHAHNNRKPKPTHNNYTYIPRYILQPVYPYETTIRTYNT